MLGPLPTKYRVSLTVIALAVFVALGVWVATLAGIPLLAADGALIGAALGTLVAYVLVHDFHRMVRR